MPPIHLVDDHKGLNHHQIMVCCLEPLFDCQLGQLVDEHALIVIVRMMATEAKSIGADMGKVETVIGINPYFDSMMLIDFRRCRGCMISIV